MRCTLFSNWNGVFGDHFLLDYRYPQKRTENAVPLAMSTIATAPRKSSSRDFRFRILWVSRWKLAQNGFPIAPDFRSLNFNSTSVPTKFVKRNILNIVIADNCMSQLSRRFRSKQLSCCACKMQELFLPYFLWQLNIANILCFYKWLVDIYLQLSTENYKLTTTL